MKPVAFDYLAAHSLEEAISALGRAGSDGKVLAGGQSLMPMLNFRLLRPSLLIDINRIPNLAYVEVAGDAVKIGALTRHHGLETSPVIKTRLPVVAAAMQHVAHLAIRNRGTIGGSLAHADPAAELPLLAVLLDARIGIQTPRGRRIAAAGSFFTAPLTTELAAEEIVTDVEFPLPPDGTGWAFEELARRAGDFALAAVAVMLSLRHGGADRIRIAVTGVGAVPQRAHAAEALLAGRVVDAAAIGAAAAAIEAMVEPMSDLHASAEYRRFLVAALARRAIAAAWRRAGGELK